MQLKFSYISIQWNMVICFHKACNEITESFVSSWWLVGEKGTLFQDGSNIS